MQFLEALLVFVAFHAVKIGYYYIGKVVLNLLPWEGAGPASYDGEELRVMEHQMKWVIWERKHAHSLHFQNVVVIRTEPVGDVFGYLTTGGKSRYY